MYKNIFFIQHLLNVNTFHVLLHVVLVFRGEVSVSTECAARRKTNYISVKIMTSENHGDYYKTLLNK